MTCAILCFIYFCYFLIAYACFVNRFFKLNTPQYL